MPFRKGDCAGRSQFRVNRFDFQWFGSRANLRYGDHACFPLWFRRTIPALVDTRRKKDRRRRPGAIGLIAARTWPPAMRTAPRWKRSTGWMARPTQTHLDTVNRPSGIRLRVCLRRNLGFESKVSRGRNPGSPSPPYCDVPRPRKNLSERAWVHGPFSIRIDHTEIKLEGSLSVRC